MEPNLQKPAPDDDPVLAELRPDSATFGRGVAVRAVIMVPLVAAGAFGSQDGNLSPAAVWSIIGVGVLIGAAAIALMVSRVQVRPSGLRIRRLIGIEKTVPSSRFAGGVFVRQYEQFGNMIAPVLIVLDGSRKRIVTLSGQVFGADGLDRLAQVLGAGRFDTIDDPITPKLLAERHPGLVPFRERRPFGFAFLVVGMIIVIIVVAALI